MSSASAGYPLLLALADECSASACASAAALLPLLERCSDHEADAIRRALAEQETVRNEVLRQHRQVVATLEAASRYQDSPGIGSPSGDDASPDPAWARLERELAELIRELRGGDPETNARLRALIRK